MLCLDGFIDDTVDYTEGVEVERIARHASVLDLQVLVVEVVIEGRAVMTSIGLSEEIEIPSRVKSPKLSIELGNSSQQRLENVLLAISTCLRYCQ